MVQPHIQLKCENSWPGSPDSREMGKQPCTHKPFALLQGGTVDCNPSKVWKYVFRSWPNQNPIGLVRNVWETASRFGIPFSEGISWPDVAHKKPLVYPPVDQGQTLCPLWPLENNLSWEWAPFTRSSRAFHWACARTCSGHQSTPQESFWVTSLLSGVLAYPLC